jgi:predicted aldo/keto reductase-like oxidoreductase
MQFRKDISALGLGCMRFPSGSEAQLALVQAAVDAGINFFDTAHLYPGNEVALGAALTKLKVREKVLVASKLPQFRCKKYADFERFFDETCTRLGTDYIDYYFIHNLGSAEAWGRLVSLGICEWLTEKKEQGKIHKVGFSFHGKSGAFVPLLDAYPWEFAMIQLNYMNETYQAGLAGLAEMEKRGLPCIIMEPLLGGKLAEHGVEIALRYLWDKTGVTCVLSGMKTPAQIHQNAAACENAAPGCLTTDEKAAISRAKVAIEKTFKIACTGCDYCMPCPRGVNIPACFTAYNLSFSGGWVTGMSQYLNSTMGFGASAAGVTRCNSCNVCEKKCPQEIIIPDALRKVRKRMEPLPVRLALRIAKKFL